MSMVQLVLNEVACSGCLRKIKRGMKKHNGIEKVEILHGSGTIQVRYDEKIIQIDEINRNLNKLTMRAFD